MAQITPFPRKTQKDVALVTDKIREYLAAMATDDAMVNKLAARMNLFIETYADIWFEPTFNLAVPSTMSQEETAALLLSIEKGVDQAAEQVNEIISKIIIERLLFEVQIYQNTRNSVCQKKGNAGRAINKGHTVRRPVAVVSTGDTTG